MRRIGAAALLLVVGQAYGQARHADPNWEPKPGDRLKVEAEDAYGATRGRFPEAVKLRTAGDTLGLRKLVESKDVVPVPKGTRVLVLQGTRPVKPAAESRTVSPGQFQREMQTALLAPRPDFTAYPVEVRILDGPLAGQATFVAERDISPAPERREPDGFRLVTEDRRRFEPFRFPKLERRGDPSVQAAKVERIARETRKKGDVVGAASCYYLLRRDYPGTPQGKAADDRLRELGLVEYPNGSLVLDPEGRLKGRPR